MLRTKTEIPKFTKFYSFNIYDNFGYTNYTKEEFQAFPSYDEHAKFPPIPFERGDHKFIFTLLYHLYWSDKSVYKIFLHLLPPKPDIPLYTFTRISE